MNSRVTAHATSVHLGQACAPFGAAVDGAVVLIGPSGAGKSDVALRLIGMGARLISDDRTHLFDEGGRLFADAPDGARGYLEVRGVGIVKLSTAGASRVVLCVALSEREPPRMPERKTWAPDELSLRAPPPLLQLSGASVSTPLRIAAAAAAIEAGALLPPDGTIF